MSLNRAVSRVKGASNAICLKANPTSSAQRLMPEVLEMIFQHSTTENRPSVVALNLSHVCQSWRAAALDISSLWSTISISLAQDTVSSLTAQRLHSFLQHQLKLSRTCPIDVDVLVQFDKILPRDSVAALHLRGLLRDLVNESNRWRRVNIRVLTGVNLEYRFCLKHMPMLEELRLNLSSADHPWHCVSVGQLSCPKLRRLELTGDFRVESAGQNPSLKCLCLRPLDSRSPFPSVVDYAEILRHSPEVQVVSLRCLGRIRTCTLPMSSTIVMRSLRELRIEHEAPGKISLNGNLNDPSDAARNAISLLSQLTLPSLEKLKISIQTKDVHVDAGRELRAFIERSCPPLKRLVIEGSHVSNIDLILALRLLPDLTHLRLKGFSRYLERLLDELTIRKSTATAPSICPNLQCLRLSDCIIHDWSVIARMILSRWKKQDLTPSADSSHFEFKECGLNTFLPQKILRCCTDGLCVEVQSQ